LVNLLCLIVFCQPFLACFNDYVGRLSRLLAEHFNNQNPVFVNSGKSDATFCFGRERAIRGSERRYLASGVSVAARYFRPVVSDATEIQPLSVPLC